MKQKAYIKDLEYYYHYNNLKCYITVKYYRNEEYNNITYKINKPFNNEKEVINFINN